jgi:hypothetical protein
MAAKCSQMVTVSQEERLYAPLLQAVRCTPYVRNHCAISTHGDTPDT